MIDNKKAIFLDIDGVILPGHHTAGSFDPDACDRVVMLAEKHGADIVLSSDWRMSWNVHDLESFIKHSSGISIDIAKYLIISNDLSRGEEIIEFMSLYENLHYENIVILDDLPADQFRSLEHHLVNTSYEVGFTGDDFMKADRLLRMKYSGGVGRSFSDADL